MKPLRGFDRDDRKGGKCFCPYRAFDAVCSTQGGALGWQVGAPSGRCRVVADNHYIKIWLPYIIMELRVAL